MKVDLTFKRGEFQLAAQVELNGGVTGICGPSGVGKSTFLALLAGLLRPNTGTLNFSGVDLIDTQRDIFVPAWKRHFGLVFQNGMLFPHLSVRDNLLYGFNRLNPNERHLDLKTVTALLEIEPLLQRRPDQLSGGERQRVALGRALLYSPRLLLLDEPLSSLDDRLKQQILPFLKRVKEETRIPMIYVTHAQAEVDYLADRVLKMEDGRLGE
ncbi:ATP-binding cassette domain-containing protein [Stenotrophobium rhamnosiphilum]|uniref:Molybdenum ABC transporter ATP-binding protein n=1 Tax=Stenotrophobium rhamnosiphilum TaxID=2029166 RepID=A0A2T5MKG6_9GAMM|nr:ATP-binding cassette domain-containing protein [Stenotrophobium rhamnosiphilum]PTU33071.1 molybdenum ABC transporter ATP-binding protein [Stenotrophobium rhamnosiphilum]